MSLHFWLFKTEPETYSFFQLIEEGKTHWNGVRNFQARNYLKQAKTGDQVLIYHSGDERCVVGIAEICREAYPDPDPSRPGDWIQVDIRGVKAFKRVVSLAEIKAEKKLSKMPLIRQSRLSCMPIDREEFMYLKKLGNQ